MAPRSSETSAIFVRLVKVVLERILVGVSSN
ncbi:hypothetical protein FOYG_02089 [Fusarium oxysporum NRRL 32931]|uniref:Uncharacterized protein n=1 Tax=Fusarium oxysporum NRRL 32931 TaxID=660029 RepID=W9J770_FUSOX|nr:hypothetical protein FOYG_02089 [Fusarium oxysporum NRRL 32931]